MADQPDATLDSVFSATRAALIAFGGFLATNGYGSSGLYKWTELAAGGICIIGPAVWGIVASIQKWRAKQAALVQGVNAGMGLAAAGAMIVKSDGTPIPATPETAKQIVQVFAPPEPAKV